MGAERWALAILAEHWAGADTSTLPDILINDARGGLLHRETQIWARQVIYDRHEIQVSAAVSCAVLFSAFKINAMADVTWELAL